MDGVNLGDSGKVMRTSWAEIKHQACMVMPYLLGFMWYVGCASMLLPTRPGQLILINPIWMFIFYGSLGERKKSHFIVLAFEWLVNAITLTAAIFVLYRTDPSFRHYEGSLTDNVIIAITIFYPVATAVLWRTFVIKPSNEYWRSVGTRDAAHVVGTEPRAGEM